MNYLLPRLRQEVAEAISKELGLAVDLVVVSDSNEDIGSDLSVACFVFAKELSRSPKEIAEGLASNLQLPDLAKVEAQGGYLNIWIQPKSIAGSIASQSKIYGTSDVGQDQTVIVDFIGLNLSKPFSVGHLRPTVQGWALIQIYKALGYEVVGDSHLGDWGTPFGMWAVAFQKWGSQEALDRDGIYELGRLYVKFREQAEQDEDLIAQAKAWLKRLETEDPEATDYRDRFYKISTDHADAVLSRLKIKADENLSESFYIESAQNYVDQLIADGLAVQQDDGSVIVDLSDQGLETPILLRKGDGSALYATSDLETIRYRVERWNPTKIIYSVGAEQQFHFKQVFALAQKLDLTPNTELVHPWFGTVDEIDDSGKRSKMSSRKSTALLENLIDIAREKTVELVGERKLSDADIDKIALGAIKFNDSAQPRQTNILFDWDRMLSLHGYSSVYIQYAAVRVASILSSVEHGAANVEQLEYDWQPEAEILSQLAKYPEAVKAAADSYEPSKIAYYLYELARRWNRYYEETPVAKSEGDVQKARIWLLTQLGTNFEHGLSLLGVEIPSEM